MRKRQMIRLESLYVQVDNTSTNKCFTVLIGLAALIALGICTKVVLAFLLLGDTHTDVDRTIGLVVTYVRNLNVTTFEELREFALNAYTVEVLFIYYVIW